jgi:hypothetical protein
LKVTDLELIDSREREHNETTIWVCSFGTFKHLRESKRGVCADDVVHLPINDEEFKEEVAESRRESGPQFARIVSELEASLSAEYLKLIVAC